MGSEKKNIQSSTFELEKRLPSCKVTKELLELLEEYVLARGAEIGGVKNRVASHRYFVTISDALGVEQLASVKDRASRIFSDTTKKINLEIDMYPPAAKIGFIQISIKFDCHRSSSVIWIRCTNVNAREIVLGLYQEILRKIEPYRTGSWIFNPPEFLFGFILAAIVALTATAMAWITMPIVNLYAGISLVVLVLYAITSWTLKPYTQFDSRRTQSTEKWAAWISYGALGTLVFGTGAAIVRHFLLGF